MQNRILSLFAGLLAVLCGWVIDLTQGLQSPETIKYCIDGIYVFVGFYCCFWAITKFIVPEIRKLIKKY